MATETKPKDAGDVPAQPSADEEWEDVQVGLGKEHDFRDGPLVAFYVGTADVRLENDPDRDSAKAQLFADVETGEQLFLWDSYELGLALAQVQTGDKVRVQFLGSDSFTGKDGPRQVKRYKVQRAPRA